MLYIRTDMNKTIATGHMMRCLSIAHVARKLGTNTTFILADEQAVPLMREQGYPTIVLDSNWENMEAELPKLQSVIKDHDINVLLIDSYMVTPYYLETLSQRTRIIYLDDMDAFVYPVHALICYAVYWKKFCYQKRYPKTKLFLGPQFTPLRPVFCDCRRKNIKPTVENLLILSGGTDNYRILERLLQNIEIGMYKRVDIICGIYYQDYEEVCSRYSRFSQIYFHKAVHNIEKYMMEADVAISAGGTTLYELCALGTPAVSYSFADNQLDNVRQFQVEGLIDYAGDIRYTNVFENVNSVLETYYDDFVLRREKSRQMQLLIDGKGSERIASALMEM